MITQVNRFMRQLRCPSWALCRPVLNLRDDGSICSALACRPVGFSPVNRSENLQRPSAFSLAGSNRRDQSVRVARVGATTFSTILNHGPVLTRTYLAMSPSQNRTWLSRTPSAVGPGLNLTSRLSVTGRGGTSEIASASSAGAGVLAPTADAGGGLGTARPTTTAFRKLPNAWSRFEVSIA